MNEANLTRFGPKIFEYQQGKPLTYSATFRATDGPAKLILWNDGIHTATIEINGEVVAEPQDYGDSREVVALLNLGNDNTIKISVTGTLGVQVTQVA